MTFQRSLHFGKAGERLVKTWLMERGYLISDTSELDGYRMQGLHRDLVLPDLMAHRGGTTKWVEVKTKSRDVPYRKTNSIRQGIEKRYWEEYLGTELVSGIPGWLALLVVEPGLLRMAGFALLKQHAIAHMGSRSAYSGKDMVFWNVDIFETFHVGADGIDPVPAKVRHPWPTTPPKMTQKQGYLDFG